VLKAPYKFVAIIPFDLSMAYEFDKTLCDKILMNK
jgi:hypothetical protein